MNIRSQRAILRPFTLDDYENLRLLDVEADIMKYTPAKVPQTEEQSRARIERYSNMKGVYACELIDSKEFVGWFMLIPTDLEHPELGFMIVKKFWGKGFATEVAAALINDLPGVSARTLTNNQASISVLKKLGFKEKRTITNADQQELFVFEKVT